MPFLSFSLCAEVCWATAPKVIPAWFHESHEQRVCRQCYPAATSELAAPLSHRLQMRQSSNLLCFYWSGSLSAALLPVNMRTTQDSLNIQRITKKGLGAHPSLSLSLQEDQLNTNHLWQICLTCYYQLPMRHSQLPRQPNLALSQIYASFSHLSLEKLLMLQYAPIISCPVHHNHREQTIFFPFLIVFFVHQSYPKFTPESNISQVSLIGYALNSPYFPLCLESQTGHHAIQKQYSLLFMHYMHPSSLCFAYTSMNIMILQQTWKHTLKKKKKFVFPLWEIWEK